MTNTYNQYAIAKLKEKLAKAEKLHKQMKSCNKIIKDKKENKIERLTEILGDEQKATTLLTPDPYNRVGFPMCEVTNNSATIYNTKKRIINLELKTDKL